MTEVSNTRPVGHLWPVRAFRATRDVFGQLSNN